MKDVFRYLCFVAIVAMATVSCSNNIEQPVKGLDLSHDVLIHAGQPDTRTVINEGVSSASFKWSADDASRIVIKENSVSGTSVTITSTDEYSTVTLGASFATESAAEYTYTASLAKNRTGSGDPKIPAAQTSTSTSYDPNADVLVAKSLTFGTTKDEFSMQFARPCVINKMTLKGLDSGESISSIVVSADKNIVGYYNEGSWKGQGSEVTISTNQTVPANGQVTVYFVTMPVEDATLTVTVTTGNYVYSKTFGSTIDFRQNEVTVFGVSSLTKNAKSDYSGTYVLTNSAGTKMATVWASGNNIPAIDVTLDNNTIYYDPDAVSIGDAVITITKITDSESLYYGMYTMEQNNLFLYAASASNNYLKGEAEADSNAYWEISESDGIWSIIASKSTNRNVLQNNGSIFSCYGSAQTAVKLHSSFAPTPVITAGSSIALSSDAVSVATSTGVSFNSNTATVTAAAYSNAECTVASTWLSVSTSGSGNSTVVNYTATANDSGAERTEYIKITATNSAARSVSKVIPVTQQAAGALKKYTLTFTSGTMQSGVNSYTSSFNTICDGFTWSLSNFNNNGCGWSYVKCGSKNDASVGTITTSTAIEEAIGTVTVTVDAATASNVNSFKLYVASNSSFTASVQEITKTIAAGDIVFDIPAPAANSYYKIAVDCKKSSNGIVTISKVVYEEAESGSGEYTAVAHQSFSFSDLYNADTDLNGTSINGTNCSIQFNKATGGSNPKYFSNGTAVRCYANNTLTVTASTGYKITSITITFGSGDGSNTITSNVGTYSGGSWTGEISNGKSVVFTVGGSSGNRRISSVTIN